MSRILGIILLVVGALILGFGINATQSITEQVVEGVSGKYTDNTMWYIIGGIAAMIGGGVLALSGKGCCRKD